MGYKGGNVRVWIWNIPHRFMGWHGAPNPQAFKLRPRCTTGFPGSPACTQHIVGLLGLHNYISQSLQWIPLCEHGYEWAHVHVCGMCVCVYTFWFFVAQDFELRASHLQGKHSITWTTAQPPFCFFGEPWLMHWTQTQSLDLSLLSMPTISLML
jgi:hypothetical protein